MRTLALPPKFVSNKQSIGFSGNFANGKVNAARAAFVAEFDLDLALSSAESGRKPFVSSKDFLRSLATSR